MAHQEEKTSRPALIEQAVVETKKNPIKWVLAIISLFIIAGLITGFNHDFVSVKRVWVELEDDQEMSPSSTRTGNSECTLDPTVTLQDSAEIRASAELLSAVSAGKLEVSATGSITVRIKSGTYAFDKGSIPPFTIYDLRNGFVALGNGTITVKRCKL